MAASLMPSTGLVSVVRTPEYSKWKVVEVPLVIGAGRVTWTVELVVRALGVEDGAGFVGELGDVEAVVEFEDGLGEVFERGEGDVGGGGELGGGGVEVGGDDVAGDVDLGPGGRARAGRARAQAARSAERVRVVGRVRVSRRAGMARESFRFRCGFKP